MWFRSGQAMEIATAPIGDSEKKLGKNRPAPAELFVRGLGATAESFGQRLTV